MKGERTLAAAKEEIARLNARFRRLKRKDGPLADRLARAKDALIDEMARLCDHPIVIATRGARRWGMAGIAFAPRRICACCGSCESRGPGGRWTGALHGRPETVLLPVGSYLSEEGRVLKKLGIDL